MGFSLAIDDFDPTGRQKGNVSRMLYAILWPIVNIIKLDYHAKEQLLDQGDVHDIIQKMHNKALIIVEGVRDSEIGRLMAMGVDLCQRSRESHSRNTQLVSLE
jgi:hypothetical protein